MLAGILFPINDFLYPYRSAKVVQKPIDMFVPKEKILYQYRENFYGIDFYNKIRTAVVEDFGELGDGIAKLPSDERKKYFLSREEFFDKIKSEKEIYCVTQHLKKLQEIREKCPDVQILWNNGAFYLLKIGQGIK